MARQKRYKLFLTEAPAVDRDEMARVLRPLSPRLIRSAVLDSLGQQTHTLVAEGETAADVEPLRLALERAGCGVYIFVERRLIDRILGASWVPWALSATLALTAGMPCSSIAAALSPEADGLAEGLLRECGEVLDCGDGDLSHLQ